MKKRLLCLPMMLCLLLCACGQQVDGAARMAEGSVTVEKVLLGAILVVAGVFCLVKPDAAWHLSHGRKYRNVKPSRVALILQGVCGVIAAAAGVAVLLM